jgi:hypothetical protein
MKYLTLLSAVFNVTSSLQYPKALLLLSAARARKRRLRGAISIYTTTRRLRIEEGFQRRFNAIKFPYKFGGAGLAKARMPNLRNLSNG